MPKIRIQSTINLIPIFKGILCLPQAVEIFIVRTETSVVTPKAYKVDFKPAIQYVKVMNTAGSIMKPGL